MSYREPAVGSAEKGHLHRMPFLAIPSYHDTPPSTLRSGVPLRRLSKAPSDAHAFVMLPTEACEQIGLYTRQGARIDLAVLSSLLAHAARNPDGCDVELAGGVRVTCKPGEFWVSLQTVSEDIQRRWLGSVAEGKFRQRFYQRVRTGAGRLVKAGFLCYERTAAPGKNQYGVVWSLGPRMAVTDLSSLPPAPPSPVLLLEGQDEMPEVSGGMTCAIDMVQSAFFKDDPSLYTRAEGRYTIFEKGREVDYMTYMRRVAERSAASDAMLSAGAWKRGVGATSPERSEAPCHFPFIVIDIDRDDPWDSFAAAEQIVYDLSELGAREEDLIVSYTGGRGFHVRVPSSVVGSPIFRGAREAERVLRRWAQAVLQEECDPCTFSPVQPVRMIGSFREESSMYVRAWKGSEFVTLSMEAVMEACAGHEPYRVPHPYEARLAPSLALALAEASDATRMQQIPSFSGSKKSDGGGAGGAVFRRACEGVSESEAWWDDGSRVHVGRSKAMFIVACGLLREDYNEHGAIEEMRRINRLYDPPMSERELKGRLASAKRRLTRDGDIAVRT